MMQPPTEPAVAPVAPTDQAVPGAKWTCEQVTEIRRWAPTLLSFRTTRDPAFRFTPGHYTRLGLDSGVDTVWRPFSMASATGDAFLEFIAVLVPGGAFSRRLDALRCGDSLRVDRSAFGFLTVGQLAPGRDLWLLASGTGIGPFVSILRDPAVWNGWERLIVVHSVRRAAELAWCGDITGMADAARRRGAKAALTYLPVVTREPGATALAARIPALLADGRLEQAAGAGLSVADSRLMVCGNPDLARELRQSLVARGFATSRRGAPGQLAFEKYW